MKALLTIPLLLLLAGHAHAGFWGFPDAGATTAKIADDGVTSPKILNSSVSTQKLATDSVTNEKLISDNASLFKVTGGAMTAEAAGDIGIGTTNPSTLFHVFNGVVSFTGTTTSPKLGIGTTSPAHELVVSDGTDNILVVNSDSISGKHGYIQMNLEASKSSDEGVLNSAALQNDDALVITGLYSGEYSFEAYIFIEQGSDNSADFDYQFDFTNFTSCRYVCELTGPGATDHDLDFITTDAAETNADLDSGEFSKIHCIGDVEFSADSSEVQFEWAQEVATAVYTSVKAGSHIYMHKEP